MPRPQFYTCQICGRGFGSASIEIHIPQCYDKAIKRWTLNPVGPRPVMPPMPNASANGSSSTGGTKAKATGTRKSTGKSGGLATATVGQGSSPGDDLPVGAGATAARSLRNETPDAFVPTENLNLHPCSKCGRKFNYDRIAYHESVCKGDQKRKVFDSSKQRQVEDEEAGFVGAKPTKRKKRTGGAMGGYKTTNDPARVPQTSWRQQHEEFIEAIRNARASQAQAQSMWGNPSSGAAGPSKARGLPARTPSAVSGKSTTTSTRRSVTGSTSTAATSRTTPKPAAKRIPPAMARQDATRKAHMAGGGQGARASVGSIRTPGEGGTRGHTGATAPAARSRAFGGGGDRFSGYGPGGAAAAGGGGGGGGGGGRILNDNSTSLGMMQAFGKA